MKRKPLYEKGDEVKLSEMGIDISKPKRIIQLDRIPPTWLEIIPPFSVWKEMQKIK